MDVHKRRSLGRGLGALMPQAPPVTSPAERMVAVDEIRPNPWQPRASFDEEAIAELAASVREQGIVQPLVVRRALDGYELVAGERRLRAAKAAGLETVPVVVRDLGDREAFEAALVENLQREDLSALDEAAAYHRLIQEFGLTQEQVAAQVGKSRPAIANTLRLLQLPASVRAELEKGKLSAGHARALLAIDDPDEQIALARETIDHGLSVRRVESRARPGRPAGRGPAGSQDVHVQDLERQLMRLLGTKVRIQPRGNGGRILIEYYSDQELEGLVAKLRAPHRLDKTNDEMI